MPNLTPTSSFDDVPELETSTLALAGPGGPMNLPAQALLNRTQWLKDNASAGSAGPYAAGSGTANACAAAYTPPITATTDGLKLRFAAAAANTGPATFAPDALTAAPVLGQAGLALQGGEIAANGEVEVTWSTALSAWVMTACSGGSVQVADGTAAHHAASKGQLDAVSAVANDAAPSADLASTAAGKGASLVGYLTGTVKSFLDSLAQTGASVGSALIGFIQSGTGAVARTVQTKQRERITFEDFGAVGDGTTDDHAAIAAAIAAYPTSTIYAGAKVYRLATELTISSAVRIVGEGMSNTQFLFDQGVNGIVISGGTNRFTLDSLSVYAAGTPRQAGIHGISSAATSLSGGVGYLDLSNIEIYGFDRGLSMTYCQLGKLRNIHAYYCNDGYYSKNSVNMTLIGGTYEDNTFAGINLDGDTASVSTSAGTLIHGVQSVNNGANNGMNFRVFANENFEATGCMFDVPSVGSILNVLLDTVSRATLSNSWVGASNGSGVKVNSGTTCKFIGLDVVNSQSFGFEINNSLGTVISGCATTGSGNVDVYIYGTSEKTVVTGNSLTSTTAANSIQDVSTAYTSVTGNTVSKAILLGATSISAGNLSH